LSLRNARESEIAAVSALSRGAKRGSYRKETMSAQCVWITSIDAVKRPVVVVMVGYVPTF